MTQLRHRLRPTQLYPKPLLASPKALAEARTMARISLGQEATGISGALLNPFVWI